jgi:hypothetical protein
MDVIALVRFCMSLEPIRASAKCHRPPMECN